MFIVQTVATVITTESILPASKRCEQPLSLNCAHFAGFSLVMTESKFDELIEQTRNNLEMTRDEVDSDLAREMSRGVLTCVFSGDIRLTGFSCSMRLPAFMGGLCAALLMFLVMPASASEPLYVKNLSPVTGLLGLPSQRDAQTAPSGNVMVALHSTLSNQYVNESNATEFNRQDGEILRFALELRYGLAENWDVQLELPWLDQSGGHLDGAIDSWHDFWGMSDGGRSNAPNNELDYFYSSPDGGFSLQDDTSGIGDISLSLSHAFYRNDAATVSLALGYKFGTGDDKDFLGSGGDDAFVALRASGGPIAELPLSWHGQVGYLRAGDSDVLEGVQEQNLWFAGVALDWQFAQRWSLIAQIDSNAAPMDSQLTGVGDNAFMATVGPRWYFAPQWYADFSLVEDIRLKTAPDVMFQASVRWSPDS